MEISSGWLFAWQNASVSQCLRFLSILLILRMGHLWPCNILAISCVVHSWSAVLYNTNAKWFKSPRSCNQTLSIFYTIYYVKLNRCYQSSHKVTRRDNEIHAFDTTFVTVSSKEETFFYERTCAWNIRQKKIAMFWQEIMTEVSANVISYFPKMSKII